MKEFLCEIYTDEVPSKLVNNLSEQFRELFTSKLNTFSIEHSDVISYGTPKRLVIYMKEIAERESDSTQEIKGPAYSIAFDEKGDPTDILNKFLESNNLEISQIITKEIKCKKYVFGEKGIQGRDAKDILKDAILYSLKNLTFPRGMRWNDSGVIFIRPIKNILVLLGDELIDFEYANIKSKRRSFGLMIDDTIEFEPQNPSDYFMKLKELYLVLDYEKRKETIKKEASRLAQNVNGKVQFDESFLEEVTNLTEFPTCFIGSIIKNNINLPDCIVESILKDHLKAFPVYSQDDNKTLPFFIGVRNGTSDFIDNVRKGYEEVARARIYDGLFFFNEDRKKPLEERINELKDVIFLNGLGSMFDKTERLIKLAKFLNKTLKIKEPNATYFEKAAYLSKGDLLTNVVSEFPELQGIIGGIYAKLDGFEDEIVNSISEQYLPRFAGDTTPKSLIGKLLSTIDKFDTLVLSIGANIEYSSSKDPFGLRKIAVGIVQVSFTFDYVEFPYEEIIEFIASSFPTQKETTAIKKEVVELLKERANSLLRSKGIGYDKANAVTNLPINVLPTWLNRAKILAKYEDDPKFEELVLTHKRIKNIIGKSKEEVEEVREELLHERSEAELFEAVKETEKLMEALIKNRDYEAVIQLLYLLAKSVGEFFDSVLVMDENKEVRNNRLALLKNVQKIYENFADFSQVVLSS